MEDYNVSSDIQNVDFLKRRFAQLYPHVHNGRMTVETLMKELELSTENFSFLVNDYDNLLKSYNNTPPPSDNQFGISSVIPNKTISKGTPEVKNEEQEETSANSSAAIAF